MPQASGRKQERESTDEEATVGDVVLRVPQRPPTDGEQENRHGNVEGTEQVRRHGAQTSREPAVDAEPHGSGNDDRERDEEEPEPIATVDVVKVARPVAYTPGRSPDRVSDSEPQRAESPAEAGDGARDGAGATSGRRAPSRGAPRGGLARCRLARCRLARCRP